MSHYRAYRIKGNKYNPAWLKTISETKKGADRKDWTAFILAWKTFAEDDNWDPWEELLASWKKPKRFKYSELKQFDQKWKLPFTPIVGTGQGLARSNRRLFDKIKAKLRSRGEGKSCWACGTTPSREVGLDAHEFWDFDFRRGVRRLTAVRFLCTDCHYLTHNANMMFLPLPDENLIRLTELFCRVNNCKLIEAYSYLTHFTFLNFGDTRTWKIDLSNLETILTSSDNE